MKSEQISNNVFVCPKKSKLLKYYKNTNSKRTKILKKEFSMILREMKGQQPKYKALKRKRKRNDKRKPKKSKRNKKRRKYKKRKKRHKKNKRVSGDYQISYDNIKQHTIHVMHVI